MFYCFIILVFICFNNETTFCIIKINENFKSALEIEKSVLIAKATKMKMIYKIVDTFVTQKLNLKKVGDGEEKDIESYFSNKKYCSYPGLTYKICDMDSKNNIGIYLEFETEWNLYMGLSIATLNNNKLEYLDPEKYKDMLQQYINKEYLLCDGTWICWDYILNSKGEKYDFKTFSDNIIEFDEKENNTEVQYFCKQIADQYNKYML